ncbi:DUF433 domain-containing protein [Gulosibacter molinativorax]|uniref:DUF433 domain-containing protein n=1 Tax=Gulosibacter molinativorax TaxID=256821 RepID=A0ABT7C9L1_9MICO|nr:DUF433 domain-containing protein [Gulosibacter molinativorax]MDJ1371885.1 DUF433 domain-containing protein [Gulosibacter molinativorax]
MSRLDRVTVNSAICHRDPTIRGMRVRVQDLLDLLHSGMSHDEILSGYEELEREDILVVIAYAAASSLADP